MTVAAFNLWRLPKLEAAEVSLLFRKVAFFNARNAPIALARTAFIHEIRLADDEPASPATFFNKFLVWNGSNNAHIAGRDISFMVAGIDIPASGRWEIAAHYVESRGNIQTLTYTV